jgi:hypothetical protein
MELMENMHPVDSQVCSTELSLKIELKMMCPRKSTTTLNLHYFKSSILLAGLNFKEKRQL